MPTLSPLRFVWCHPMKGEPYVGVTDETGITLSFNSDTPPIEYVYAPEHDVYFRPTRDGGRGYHFNRSGTYAVIVYPEGREFAQPDPESGTWQEK